MDFANETKSFVTFQAVGKCYVFFVFHKIRDLNFTLQVDVKQVIDGAIRVEGCAKRFASLRLGLYDIFRKMQQNKQDVNVLMAFMSA